MALGIRLWQLMARSSILMGLNPIYDKMMFPYQEICWSLLWLIASITWKGRIKPDVIVSSLAWNVIFVSNISSFLCILQNCLLLLWLITSTRRLYFSVCLFFCLFLIYILRKIGTIFWIPGPTFNVFSKGLAYWLTLSKSI